MDWHWQQYFTAISLVCFLAGAIAQKEPITRMVAIVWYGMVACALISGGFFHG